jgi:hypothetical protein
LGELEAAPEPKNPRPASPDWELHADDAPDDAILMDPTLEKAA